jgi:hypothetical protein
MSTRELYVGGGQTTNVDRSIFPAPAFSNTDPNQLALKPAAHKGPASFGLTRALDFQWESALKQYVNAQAAAGTPIAQGDIIGAQVIPPNVLLLGLFVRVVRPQLGVTFTPSTRNGGLTWPAVNCDNVIVGQFAVPNGSTWITGQAGEVTAVNVTNAGSGYTSAPAVTLTGGAGSGATAVASLSPFGVGSATVTAGGTGYTAAPTVSISGGGGSGATATATVSAGAVTAITITDAGTGYTSQPTISFDGVGTGAAATANLTATVDNVTITDAGTGYTSAPTVAFSGGGGTGAAATAVISVGPQVGLTNATFNAQPDILDLTVTDLSSASFGNLRIEVTPLLMDFTHGQF